MPTPTSTTRYGPSLSLLLKWRGASTRKRARIAEPTSLHLYAQRTERSTAKASISWNASLPVWPQSGTLPILELWASFVNACPSQFFGHQSTAFGAPGESSFRSPLNLEPRWLLSCNNLHNKHPKHFHSWKKFCAAMRLSSTPDYHVFAPFNPNDHCFDFLHTDMHSPLEYPAHFWAYARTRTPAHVFPAHMHAHTFPRPVDSSANLLLLFMSISS